MLISCLRQGEIMKNEIIREFYSIIDMFEVSLDALKWINNSNQMKFEHIVNQNEILYKKLLAFGINYVGDSEEVL